MPTLLTDPIARHGDAVALTDEHGTTSWREFGDRVDRWCHALRGAGLRPGDRVAVVLGNRSETYAVVLGCLHAGLVLVPVNWHLTAPEIAHVVVDSGAAALVVDPAHAAVAADAVTGIDGCATRLVLGACGMHGFAAVDPVLAAVPSGPLPDEVCGATMLYTSGTTGAPKGVDNGLFRAGAPLSRVARTAAYARIALGVPADDTVLLDGPWFHSSQLFFSLLPLLLGSRLVIRPRFDAAATLAVIDAEQIGAAHLVPTQLVRLLRLSAEQRAGFSGASLTQVWHGSGPCPLDVKYAMIDWWGPVLTEYYGATEGGAVSLIGSAEWLAHPGSVGRALPGSELLVVDDAGAPVPPGVRGRVFVRRRGRPTFRYHNAPGTTADAHLAPDTFTFGELGRLDADGYLYLDGRAKEIIITGGVNVYPAEVEAVLTAHPAVADAAVLGVPDHEFGERVVAVIETVDGLPIDPAGLDAHCRTALAGFKVPRAYHLVPALPREPTGKLRRAALAPLLPADRAA